MGVPVWGAFGLPALGCGNMWPAHVWLVLPSPAGDVRVEDRLNVAHAAPQCAAKRVPQLSHTLAGSVAADGSVTATWTRPLVPAPTYQQPAIQRGAPTPVIGAYALGAEALPFPACGTAGLPFHTNVLAGVSVDFLAGTPRGGEPVDLPSVAAPPSYSGLASLAAVCGDSCAALAHLDVPTGGVSFPSANTPSLYPLLTALDSAGHVVHALAYNNSAAGRAPGLFVASLSADTGALVGTCATRFEQNDGYVFANLNFAFDSKRGEVIIASCTDASCVGPLNITALNPGTCATRNIASLSAEELDTGGTGAVDPYARVLVLSLARGGKAPGLAVVAINIDTGAVLRVTPETQDTPYVQSLVFDDASRSVYGLAFTQDGASQPYLVAIDTKTGRLRQIAAVAGCAGALPDSLAVSADGERLFFVGAGAGGAATLFSIFAANATISSAAPLQGALSIGDASPALFWLP